MFVGFERSVVLISPYCASDNFCCESYEKCVVNFLAKTMADNNQPSSSQECPGRLDFINRNGGIVLLRAGHQYAKRRDNQNGSSIWRCVNWRKKCRGALTLKDNNVLKEINHQCEPDENRNIMAQKLDECREKVLSSNFAPIPNIYNEFTADLKDFGFDLLNNLPAFANIKSALYNARNKEAGIQKIQCKSANEVTIPSQFKDFVLADYNDVPSNTRIIIFTNVQGQDFVGEIEICLSDGIFKIPFPFMQLYSIHGDLGSDAEHTRIVPLIYGLLNKKDETTYRIFFQLIKENIPQWQPSKYLTDFEQAAMNAISSVFPLIEVKGCYFHFSQNVWKRGKELNLTKMKHTRRHVALSALLPLLPRDSISDGWCYIMEDSPDTKEVQAFNDYMVTQWLEDERFVDTWCAFNERHRTTNAVESWHFKLNTSLPKNANLYQLLHILKQDADLQDVRAILHKSNERLSKRRKTESILRDQWIQYVTREFLDKKISIGHFLEKLRQ